MDKKIYFKNPCLDKGLIEFLHSLFSEYRYADFYSAVMTFKDKECTKVECRPARRSFQDIVKIVNTYYPNKYSLNRIATSLYLMEDFLAFYCPDIQKHVFMRDERRSTNKWKYSLISARPADTVDSTGFSYTKDFIRLLIRKKKRLTFRDFIGKN